MEHLNDIYEVLVAMIIIRAVGIFSVVCGPHSSLTSHSLIDCVQLTV